MTHLKTHSPMHLKRTQCIDRSGTTYKLGMGTTTLDCKIIAFEVEKRISFYTFKIRSILLAKTFCTIQS
jgi:hypothetical protein